MSFDPIDFARQSISYHTGKEWPSTWNKINYVLRSDGLWEIRKNKIGVFYNHLYTGDISGFPKIGDDDHVEEGFQLALPKIPRSLLNQVLSFFRQLCDEHDFEAYAQFYWDPDASQYWIRVPTQKVSKGRVEYDSQADVDSRHILVCEIHSHNSMAAFFSGTDDRDEKARGDRFFGVVGRLDTGSPEIKLSYILGGGERKYISIEGLFEEEGFPQVWLQQVQYIDNLPNPEFVSRQQQQQQEDEEEVAEDEEMDTENGELFFGERGRIRFVDSSFEPDEEEQESEWPKGQDFIDQDKYRLRRGY